MPASKEIEIVLLIADLSGYTALAEAHGNVSAAEIVTRYVEVVQGALHPGARLVERVGDEVLIVAADAKPLVLTAISLQKTIDQEPFFPIMHAGIHAGSVLELDGHYYGRALNLAARVASYAAGDQILCTEQVTTRASDLHGVTYQPLGLIRFKNVPDSVAIFEVVAGRERVGTDLIDPVCRMQIRQDTALARLPFGGKTYYFCSFDCAKMFANRPELFLEG